MSDSDRDQPTSPNEAAEKPATPDADAARVDAHQQTDHADESTGTEDESTET